MADSHDATWEHILKTHRADVSNVDVLIAPHHGRKSDRDWDFLNIVNPKITLFGNADSQYLAYKAWSNRGLPIITNNQAGNIIIAKNDDASPQRLDFYVTCEAYARRENPNTLYSASYDAYYLGFIK